ncbi:MAG TPA: C13 family peptidase [Stellaceae bacterium]|nr:C13 family peptidase [Stellaceae bacterium]
MPLRLIFRLCAAALLFLGGGASLAAAPASGRWQVVLVAGDNAEPVFDNAVAAVSDWLQADGVRTATIHRLSASPPARDPAIEPASVARVLRRIASLQARPGERCLVFITSHGKQEGIWLAASGEFLEPAGLARALSVGCAAVPTVVILSSCYSGVFAAGPMKAPNRIILSAARADRPSFGCQADRTYTVFDECLLSALPRAPTWRAVYEGSRDCVTRRERRLAVLPSQPQAAFGTAVRNLAVR